MTLKSALTLTTAFILVVSMGMFAPAFANRPNQAPAYGPGTTDAVTAPSGSAQYMAEAPLEKLPVMVWVATDHIYTVKKGDNLTRIAKLFNIPMDELTSASYNPTIAARKNKNMLYKGEKIRIPRFRKELRPLSDVADTELLVMVKSDMVKLTNQLDKYEARIKELEAENAERTSFERLLYSAILILAIALVISGSISSMRRTANRPRKVSKHETMKMIYELSGSEIAELLDEPLVYDEYGNPVSLKNAKVFLAIDKRARLRELPASAWQKKISAASFDRFFG